MSSILGECVIHPSDTRVPSWLNIYRQATNACLLSELSPHLPLKRPITRYYDGALNLGESTLGSEWSIMARVGATVAILMLRAPLRSS